MFMGGRSSAPRCDALRADIPSIAAEKNETASGSTRIEVRHQSRREASRPGRIQCERSSGTEVRRDRASLRATFGRAVRKRLPQDDVGVTRTDSWRTTSWISRSSADSSDGPRSSGQPHSQRTGSVKAARGAHVKPASNRMSSDCKVRPRSLIASLTPSLAPRQSHSNFPFGRETLRLLPFQSLSTTRAACQDRPSTSLIGVPSETRIGRPTGVINSSS